MILPFAKLAAQLLDGGGAVFNVKHPLFGAVGDGTDETALVQAALGYVHDLGGGVVLVPADVYMASLPTRYTDTTLVVMSPSQGVLDLGALIHTHGIVGATRHVADLHGGVKGGGMLVMNTVGDNDFIYSNWYNSTDLGDPAADRRAAQGGACLITFAIQDSGEGLLAGDMAFYTAGDGAPDSEIAYTRHIWIHASAETVEIITQLIGKSGTFSEPTGVVSPDQSTSRLKVENTGVGGHEYHLIAGKHSIGQTGFTIFDVTFNEHLLHFASGGEATFSGDITAPGGYHQTIDGWYQDDVAAGQTDVELIRGAGRFRAVRAGSVLGLIVTSTEERTAGTLTVTVFKNTGLAGAAGATIGLAAVLDGTNTSRKATTQAKDTNTFAAGDELYAVVTTDGAWAPVTADIRVSLEVET